VRSIIFKSLSMMIASCHDEVKRIQCPFNRNVE